MPVKKKLLREIVKKTFEETGNEEGSVNIVLADDALLKELNARYRGIDAPTDVLSFYYGEKDLLGEIIISLDTCKNQADEKGHSFERELAFLVAHGLLHLLGWDDEEEEGWKAMIDLQEKIINKIEGLQ